MTGKHVWKVQTLGGSSKLSLRHITPSSFALLRPVLLCNQALRECVCVWCRGFGV